MVGWGGGINLGQKQCFICISYRPIYSVHTGSRSTFEFPSRVNLSAPSLYCIARTLGKLSRHSIGLARLNLLLLKGQGCVYSAVHFLIFYTLYTLYTVWYSTLCILSGILHYVHCLYYTLWTLSGILHSVHFWHSTLCPLSGILHYIYCLVFYTVPLCTMSGILHSVPCLIFYTLYTVWYSRLCHCLVFYSLYHVWYSTLCTLSGILHSVHCLVFYTIFTLWYSTLHHSVHYLVFYTLYPV